MQIRTLMWRFVLNLALLLIGTAFAQETTGGLQGTIKDSSGAVIGGAHVVVTGTTLVGNKAVDSEASGYYRFANLPPGIYTVEVSAKGFRTAKREGLTIEIGRLPTMDIVLEVGSTSEVVDVTGAAPVIDVTTNTNQTNVTSEVLQNVPLEGRSFQSVIQFAPMARNEPLAGMTANGMGMGGTGGAPPGSSGNGNAFGYSVGGGADSENAYLVEGQDTEQLSGGYSKANVPFQFIQEVQIKSSGIEAEHGGALGGVVNVVMKKGGNAYHGSVFGTYEGDSLDANNSNIYLRYDPLGSTSPTGDLGAQDYNPKKDHFRIAQPGVTVGGPVVKDRLWFFLGFAPQYNSLAKKINYGAIASNPNASFGNQYFTQDLQQYYGTARLDATLTQKIRLFGSWLYQYARETGANLPISDPAASEAGFENTSALSNPSTYSHGLGWVAPNSTYIVGADISLTPKIVSTTRFGYFFENYHDFGWQTSTPNLVWNNSGINGCDNSAPAGTASCGANSPYALPAALQQGGGTQTAPYTGTFTLFNANKHHQFDQDVAFFKGGWWGTHNIKVGYQLNHLVNQISQNGNVPLASLTVGGAQSLGHGAVTGTGTTACNNLIAEWGVCAGQYGYITVQDFATVLPSPASDWNHAFFVQDAWTVGHGLTLNLGLRVERESLPAPGGVKVPAIDFAWSDKIEPRLGAAWGSPNGKLKIFGSYGVVNDVMKLLLAQTSWGAQVFEQCFYPLGPDGTSAGFSVSAINLVFKAGRACPSGPVNTQANFAGSVPAALTDAASNVSIIENVNFRPAEPVAPGLKPYRQHEFVAGVDYAIGQKWAFEARYDRRRLDHVIEDSSLSDPTVGELYAVVNPGEGVNRTIDGYANYLQSLGQAFLVPGYSFNSGNNFGTCPSCPRMPKAVRNYEGMELRVTKSTSHGWAGMFAYTYSRLWGNYAGLTNTDQADGNAAGRNSPDTSRAFDEPFYYYGADGKSTNGFLPTDRPSTFKGDVYYQLPWKNMTTTFGLFQFAYQGTPISSYIDLAATTTGLPFEATHLFGRDQWVNTTIGPGGSITLGNPYLRRTPWFTQTDFNLGHAFKINKNNEAQMLRVEATVTNLLNQHSVVQYYEGINSINAQLALHPGYNAAGNGVNLADGAFLYQTLMEGYKPQQWINGVPANPVGCTKNCTNYAIPAVIQSSWYGKPEQYQRLRNIRLGVTFTF